jgi:hypothetical protein
MPLIMSAHQTDAAAPVDKDAAAAAVAFAALETLTSQQTRAMVADDMQR